jgi:predicted kinase
LLWDLAVEILNVGRNVVLDWNFWSRQRRSDARERADRAGYPILLHWLDVALEVAVDRATGRLAVQPRLAYRIDADAVRHFASIFEPPADDEELAVQRHVIPPTADSA